MKFKDLNEEQKKLGERLHTMCRNVGYDFEDFVTVENGDYYYIESDIVGLMSEGNLFTVYLTKSGVYSIRRYCHACSFSEIVESRSGMSQGEVEDLIKRGLDRSHLINIGSIEMEHECEEGVR